MSIDLKGRNLLTLKDYTIEEIDYLLDLAQKLKEKKAAGIRGDLLDRKNIVLLFEKTSTRTRCAFEVACYDEGANVTFLDVKDTQIEKKESMEDTAKVLSRYYDGIEFRGFEHKTVEELAEYSEVPVWNGLTDLHHPTQVLADFLTIKENIDKPFSDINLVYIGDGRNNVSNSLLIGAAKMGMNFTCISPKSLWPKEDFVEEMKSIGDKTGVNILITDEKEAVKDADVIYTDVWVSMGEEHLFIQRIKELQDYRVDDELIEMTGNEDVIFLHCLPSFHDRNTIIGEDIYRKYGLDCMEVTDKVFRGKHSKVFDQAENRMHTIKAIMVATVK